MQEAIEPLAKFHAKVDKSGRVIIPKYIRDIYEINQGDFVVMIVRKVRIDKKDRKVYVLRQVKFSAKVNERGVVVVPKQLREHLDIKPGDLLEVLLMDHYKSNEHAHTTTYTYIF
ncbi:putative protein Predicted transcription regulator, SpoVT/AbrB family [Pyrococcus sp. NA2]|uniref:AbrB/MazE/SpoVT family DNA-binding domain-containing protein n=1 Tax=Pyrococcus sp. (strain NA2) TaxID=342949 RepID=UPI000209AD39|nr:AbrB/MazE/SpoVT family DNA-binding domain-containing protein [Pyrococcus sp. NA2]AEC51597.1 putative protein Predicted transcription regulator, SpoVT/AbrB family [Pyrococcus sp. NA2]